MSPHVQTAPRLQGLAPIADAGTRLLVLGSFPSVASLQTQRYYAHPRNQFWKILSVLWQEPLTDMPYPERTAALRRHGLGVWDVYASCQRIGSLDSAIREPVLNDLAALLARSPQLQAIAHNGGESARHMRLTRAFGVQVLRLPSTSPANASWSFERKLAAWRAALAPVGLCAGEAD
jgi:hypoxanthine-DNA glycosylase